jgi:hypothetical protein
MSSGGQNFWRVVGKLLAFSLKRQKIWATLLRNPKTFDQAIKEILPLSK